MDQPAGSSPADAVAVAATAGCCPIGPVHDASCLDSKPWATLWPHRGHRDAAGAVDMIDMAGQSTAYRLEIFFLITGIVSVVCSLYVIVTYSLLYAHS